MGWKLMRDNMEPWLREHGVSGTFRTAEPADLMAAMKRKIIEEAAEYAETGDLGELWDLLDVISAVFDAVTGTARAAALSRHNKKLLQFGGYNRGLMWTCVPEEHLGEQVL